MCTADSRADAVDDGAAPVRCATVRGGARGCPRRWLREPSNPRGGEALRPCDCSQAALSCRPAGRTPARPGRASAARLSDIVSDMHGPAAGQHVVGRASGQHVPGPNRHHRFFSHAGGPTTHYARPGLASLLDRLGPALVATDVQAGATDVNEGTIAIIATDVIEGTEHRTANVTHGRHRPGARFMMPRSRATRHLASTGRCPRRRHRENL